MITKYTPNTWQQLQDDVAQILSECGFNVEVEKKVQTVRGEVELDVSAEETIKGRKYTISCECKHWKSRIPQTVIHSFRSVVSDLGINVGYIISLNGFQSGSVKASDYTNIELVTWCNFQDKFEESWLEHYFSPYISERLDPILTYTEPLAPKWYGELTDNEKQEYERLYHEYLPFGLMIMNFTHYMRIFSNDRFPALPLIKQKGINPEIKSRIPKKILIEESYKEFLDLALEFGEQGIKKFRKIRDRHKVLDSPKFS